MCRPSGEHFAFPIFIFRSATKSEKNIIKVENFSDGNGKFFCEAFSIAQAAAVGWG